MVNCTEDNTMKKLINDVNKFLGREETADMAHMVELDLSGEDVIDLRPAERVNQPVIMVDSKELEIKTFDIPHPVNEYQRKKNASGPIKANYLRSRSKPRIELIA